MTMSKKNDVDTDDDGDDQMQKKMWSGASREAHCLFWWPAAPANYLCSTFFNFCQTRIFAQMQNLKTFRPGTITSYVGPEVPVGEKRDVMKTLIFMWKDAKNRMLQDVALFISFQPLYVVEMGMFSVESFNLNLKQTMCTFFLPILKCSLRLSISYMSSIIFALYNQ